MTGTSKPFSKIAVNSVKAKSKNDPSSRILVSVSLPMPAKDDVVKKLEEELLICSICSNQFNQPKILDCQHTFCHSCIKTKIRNKAKSIPCPVCSKRTYLTSNGADDLTVNMIIQSLMEIINGFKLDQMKQLENSITPKRRRNKPISLNQLKAPYMSAATSSKNKSPHPSSSTKRVVKRKPKAKKRKVTTSKLSLSEDEGRKIAQMIANKRIKSRKYLPRPFKGYESETDSSNLCNEDEHQTMYEDSDEDEESESSQQSESESECNEDEDSEFTNPSPAQRVKSSFKRTYRPENDCSDRICKFPDINNRNEFKPKKTKPKH